MKRKKRSPSTPKSKGCSTNQGKGKDKLTTHGKKQQSEDRRDGPPRAKSTANEGKQTKLIAFVDLFAGLRTVHVAVKGTQLKVVLAHAAEKCSFANGLAKKNNIQEKLYLDVRDMDLKWAEAYVEEALERGAEVIVLFGGFPCKGLSKVRGASRENLENKDSKLFWELLRVIRELKKVAGGRIRIYHAIENVMMDDEPEDTISHELGCRPVKIGAGPVCASARDRLFWLNFTMNKQEGEELQKGKRRDELTLKQDPEKLNFWDEGWGPTQASKASKPTVQG